MDNLVGVLAISCLTMAAALFLSMLNLLFQDYKISRWLKKNRYDKWEELGTIGGLGPGFINSKRGWTYLYSKEDEESEFIGDLKRAFRKSAEITKYVLITFILTTLILVIVAILGK